MFVRPQHEANMKPEDIDVTNYHECLKSYQSSIMLAATAAFFLLLYTIDAQSGRSAPVQIATGGSDVSLGVAWTLALAAYVIMFGYSLSTLKRARTILQSFRHADMRKALARFPSFATHQAISVRLGTVLIPMALVATSMIYEISKTGGDRIADQPVGMLVVVMLVFATPVAIMTTIRNPLGAEDAPNRNTSEQAPVS